MVSLFATAFRRYASTLFVLLALFAAGAATQAPPHAGHADSHHAAAGELPSMHASHGMALSDSTGDPADHESLPCLEDGTAGFDDTCVVPPHHVVMLARIVPTQPAGLQPGPHAHHFSAELRPPIA